jgi:hypothetical protein
MATYTLVPGIVQDLIQKRASRTCLLKLLLSMWVLPALATLGVPTVNVPENIFPFLQQVVQGGTVRGQEVAANVLRALFELFGGAPLDFGVGITI